MRFIAAGRGRRAQWLGQGGVRGHSGDFEAAALTVGAARGRSIERGRGGSRLGAGAVDRKGSGLFAGSGDLFGVALDEVAEDVVGQLVQLLDGVGAFGGGHEADIGDGGE